MTPQTNPTSTNTHNPTPARTSPLGMDNFVPSRNLLGTKGAAGNDIYIQIYSHQAKTAAFLVPAVAEPMLVWVVRGSAIVEEREIGGDWQTSHVKSHDFFLTHSHSPYEIRWQANDDTPFEVMHLYLPIPLLETVARKTPKQTGQSYSCFLGEVSGIRDEKVSTFLGLIYNEITGTQPASLTYIEGIVQSLTVHLVRQYGRSDKDAKNSGSRLPAHRLHRVQSYFKDHIDEKFDLDICAKEAGLSPYHFSRLFKKTTGTTPSHYFIAQKIAKSQQLMRETDLSILEISLMLGYESSSHFSKIFKRETGVTPRQYRQK